MLNQQKQEQFHRQGKHQANFDLIKRIDIQNNNIKMLIKAIRNRSLPQNSSNFKDSDGSKIEIKSDNGPLRSNRSRSTFFIDVAPSSPQSDAGDFILNNKCSHIFSKNKSRRGHILQKLQILNPKNIICRAEKVFERKVQDEQKKQKAEDKIQKKASEFRIKSKKQEISLSMKSKEKHNFKQQNPQKDCFDIRQLNNVLLISHIQNITPLHLHSTPQQIYAFFESIHLLVKIQQPKDTIIKRYTNCIYFGQRVLDSLYQGMIWYYRRVYYIGQFVSGKKHGQGIEINLQDQTTWKGNFYLGQKTGYFQVQTPQYYYYGNLSNGQFHGEGHLSNNISQFKGNFCEGVKYGTGFQKFNDKTEYRGQYFNNKFDGQGQLKATNYYYKGLFKNGKPDGPGFERTKQYEYLGNFVMGKKQGKGKLKTSSGIAIDCHFKNNLIVEDQAIDNGIYYKVQNSLSRQLSALDEQKEEGEIENMLSAFSRKNHLLPPMRELSPINSNPFIKK